MIGEEGTPAVADRRARTLIGEVAVLLAADRTPRETFASLCEILTRVIDVSVCFVALRKGAALRVEYVHDHGATRPDPAIVIERGGRSWETMRTGRSQIFRCAEAWAAVARQPLNKAAPRTEDVGDDVDDAAPRRVRPHDPLRLPGVHRRGADRRPASGALGWQRLPSGLAGEMIARHARALSVVDAFSAMTLDRPYHRAIAPADALQELERCAGTQFDPAMVASFCALRRAG